MIKVIVDNGAIEVYCLNMAQAREYIVESIRRKKHETFSIWEIRDEREKQVESRRQVQESVQEPAEAGKGGDHEGL